MSIPYQCDGCGEKLRVKDDLAGQRVRCPSCKYLQTVPDAPPPEPRRSRRRRRREVAKGSGKYFDPLGERKEDILPIRWLNDLFNMGTMAIIVVSFLFFECIIPFSLLVMFFSSDRDASRNAGLGLAVGFVRLIIVVMVYYLMTHPMTAY